MPSRLSPAASFALCSRRCSAGSAGRGNWRRRYRRAEALAGEIARRVETRVAEIEHEAPAYLAIALSPRPEGAERWREGAAAIEDYRERHGVTDPEQALGPEPDGSLTRAERRPVERAVEDGRSAGAAGQGASRT